MGRIIPWVGAIVLALVVVGGVWMISARQAADRTALVVCQDALATRQTLVRTRMTDWRPGERETIDQMVADHCR